MRPDTRVGAILIVAFALRLYSNWWLTVPTPVIDAAALWYHSTASSLAAGLGYIHHFTRMPTAEWPPGYPAILAALLAKQKLLTPGVADLRAPPSPAGRRHTLGPRLEPAHTAGLITRQRLLTEHAAIWEH